MPHDRYTAFQAAFRGYRLRYRLRRLPAREAEKTIRALHANAYGFRRIAVFLVFFGLFFSLVFSSADVEFQRKVHQGLESHLGMVREPCTSTTICDLALEGFGLGYREIDEMAGHRHLTMGSFVVVVLELVLLRFLWCWMYLYVFDMGFRQSAY